jgi:hypothetical protein
MRKSTCYKRQKLATLLLFASSLLIMQSCDQDNLLETKTERTATERRQDELQSKFAILLKDALAKPEVRVFLKEQAIENFNGDYGILYAKVRTEPIELAMDNGKVKKLSFEEVLAETPANGRSQYMDNSFLNTLVAEHPLLEISIPETASYTAETWETSTEQPSIAIVDSYYDDQTTLYVQGYNPAGNEIMVDAVNEPSTLFLVVSASERIVAVSKIDGTTVQRTKACGSLLYEDDIYNYYERVSYETCSYPSPTPSTGGGSATSNVSTCRAYENTEWLYQINCTNLKSFEGWLRGAPELRVRVMSPKFSFSSLIHTGEMEPKRRSDINNKWWTKELQLFKWNTGYSGDAVVFYWYEVDGGAHVQEVKLNAGYTEKDGVKIEASTTITIGKKDESIGDLLVLIDDCRSENIFDVASLSWKVKIK